MTRPEDIEAANRMKPEYIGFVFWDKSRRNISKDVASRLKKLLDESIKAVGVFVDADIDFITKLCNEKVIDMVQLHGSEDEQYIEKLRQLTDAPIIKAFEVKSEKDIEKANRSSADYILLDAGKGEGNTFSWELVTEASRPFFLAGGLDVSNVSKAIGDIHPFAVDVSSGIETGGLKDEKKMTAFLNEVVQIK